MSDQHEESGLFKSPKQLIVVVLLAFIVPIGIAVMFANLATSGRHGKDGSEEAVEQRIHPVARVEIAAAPAAAPAQVPAAQTAAGAPAAEGAKPPVTAAAAPASAAAPAPQAAAAQGKSVFESTCAACHATGAAGAPKLGDKAAWAPRIAQGMDTLIGSALHGKNVMPPKGGNASLSDAQVKAAVEFMVGQSK